MTQDRIFISSTCFDLIDLRAEIERELRELELVPVMSDRATTEFETYPGKNSIETCLINLRNCQAVIVILSQRYGPSLKKAGFPDISATHLEYKAAIQAKIPVFFYVRDRLEADFNFYNGKNSDKLKWVSPKDVGLFKFFKEHKTLVNKNKNNWYYSFRDVTDLKERIKIDLKKFSSKATLSNITKSGQAPCLIVSFEGRITPNTKRVFAIIKVKNIGNSPAIDPGFSYAISEKIYEETDSKFIGHSTLQTLSAGESGQTQANIELTDEMIKEQFVPIIIKINYHTILGHYLADISHGNFTLNWQRQEVGNGWFSYDTKVYYHSSAITQLTWDGKK